MHSIKEHFIPRIIEIFLSKEFRIFFLFSVILNEVIFHLDPFTLSIRTNADILYDFSGSWRNHISRFLGGEQLYDDFYYPYPPIGFYLISGLFYLTGPNIFYQTLVTSLVGIFIHIGLYLLVERKILDEKFKSVILISSLFFLNGSKHEIFLGGNPFPLVLGFLFFVFALVYSDRVGLSTLLVLMAASCKHEFWIGAFLLTVYFTYRSYKITLPIVIFIVIVNLSLGYTSLDIITGMGRSSWARWNFHWEAVIVPIFFCIPIFFCTRNIKIATSYVLLIIIIFHFIDQKMVLYVPLFLPPIILFLTTKNVSTNSIFVLSLILSLQARRGFEWNEFTFDCLLPILIGYQISKLEYEKKPKYIFFIIILLVLSIYRFTISNATHIASFVKSDKFLNATTSIGNISSWNDTSTILRLKEVLEGESVFTFPFCPGIGLICGSHNTSPVTYYYNRDYINTFDYYDKKIGNPMYLVLDEEFFQWEDYPNFYNSLYDWELKCKSIDLIGQYPEITNLLNKNYSFFKKIDNFKIYKRNTK